MSDSKRLKRYAEFIRTEDKGHAGIFPDEVGEFYLASEADAVISALEDALAECEAVFDANWEADQRAIKQWQAETGEVKVWPDRCDMVVWLLNKHDKEKAAWEAKEKALLELVNQQAEDEGLWFDATTAPEAYLQQELRKLHVAIEGKSIGEAILNREQEKP